MFYSFRNASVSAGPGGNIAELLIYDEIGFWGVTAKRFYQDLTAAVKGASMLRIRVNSPGGEVPDALAIYNMLRSVSIPTEAVVDGVAASAASIVLMAGQKVLMPGNTFIMIHLPQWVSIGTADQMRKDADTLDAITNALVGIYAAKTKLEPAELLRMLSEETWLTANEAVKLGFADEVSDAVKVAALASLSKYPNAPTSLIGETAKPHEAPMDKVNPTEAAIPADATTTITQTTQTTAAAAVPDPAAAFQARATEINALCKLAGKPALAGDFIASTKTTAEIRDALLAAAATAAPIDTTKRSGDGAKASANLSPMAVFAKWNGVAKNARR